MGNSCCDGERGPPITLLRSKAEVEALATTAKDVEATLPILQNDVKRIKDALTTAEKAEIEGRMALTVASNQTKPVLEDAWDLLESARASLVRSTLHLTLRQSLPTVLPKSQGTEAIATRLLSGQEDTELPKYIRLATEGDEGKARKDVGRIRLKLDTAGVALRAAIRTLVLLETRINQRKSNLSSEIVVPLRNIEGELKEIHTSKGPGLREAVLLDEEIAKFAQVSRPSFLYEQVIILGKVILDINARTASLTQQLNFSQLEANSRIEELKEAEKQIEASVEDLSFASFPSRVYQKTDYALSDHSSSTQGNKESEEYCRRSISQLKQTIEEETRGSRQASEGLHELRDSLASSRAVVQTSKARVLLSLLQLREVRVTLQALGRWRIQGVLGRQKGGDEESMEERPREIHSISARQSQPHFSSLPFARNSS